MITHYIEEKHGCKYYNCVSCEIHSMVIKYKATGCGCSEEVYFNNFLQENKGKKVSDFIKYVTIKGEDYSKSRRAILCLLLEGDEYIGEQKVRYEQGEMEL